MTEANLSTTRAMADFYGEYCREHGGRTPPDEQAFRDFLANKLELLQRANLTPDAMFVSPRENGAAIQWVYGMAPPNGPMGATIIAYETSATDGRRFVLTSRGFSDFLDEPQFQAAFPTPP